ncbi:DUF4157 domain-containing protein [Nostoc sp. PCC 7107]|uniref:eCIS core domain-containing protein n=1 Tax=Nostoc sp. PCC 7107 TaxID=317936 RepID=UPI00029EC4CE|nr:DUF4157 domain-containing protein [Nostoc sp. PCC 7107]AFY43816.1 hypothetical protein Nos7107_3228 [Nostoc sp. PCC 7107]
MYKQVQKTGKQAADSSTSNPFAPRPFKVESLPEPDLNQNTEIQKQELSSESGLSRLSHIPIFPPGYQPPPPPRVQMKLNIGEPGDKYEQEAERVAPDVVQQINAPLQAGYIQHQPTQPIMQRVAEGGMAASPDEAIQAKGEMNGNSQESNEKSHPNQTGLPDELKAGVENLSGYSLDDVKVHYNSPKPAHLQALAYTQGTEIHVAPGQEEHLPHEAWHVVQQMQGRVKPTMQMKGLQIDDNEALEKEADVMGERAKYDGSELSHENLIHFVQQKPEAIIIQRMVGKYLCLRDPVIIKEYHVKGWVISVYNADEGTYFVTNVLNSFGNLAGNYKLDQLDFDPDFDYNRRDKLETDSEESDDSDHGSEDADTLTEDLYPDELKKDEFEEIKGYEEILIEIFDNLCTVYQINIDKQQVWDRFYEEWSQSVVTRQWWQEFKKRADQQKSENGSTQPIQMKRTGNTDSYQEKYQTANFGEFKQVTYRRDGKGNINFSNTKSHTAWTDPINRSTYVKLNQGMKDKKYGIMSGGQKVKLAGASRAQHFAIGDKLCSWAKANRKSKWTWHHLSKEYEMVLVDMRVHAKHGHNGGVLLWK